MSTPRQGGALGDELRQPRDHRPHRHGGSRCHPPRGRHDRRVGDGDRAAGRRDRSRPRRTPTPRRPRESARRRRAQRRRLLGRRGVADRRRGGGGLVGMAHVPGEPPTYEDRSVPDRRDRDPHRCHRRRFREGTAASRRATPPLTADNPTHRTWAISSVRHGALVYGRAWRTRSC